MGIRQRFVSKTVKVDEVNGRLADLVGERMLTPWRGAALAEGG